MAVSLEVSKEAYARESYELLGPLLMGYVRQPGKKDPFGDILDMMQEEGARIITRKPRAIESASTHSTLLVDENKKVAVHLLVNRYQGFRILDIFSFKNNQEITLTHSIREGLDHLRGTTLEITDMKKGSLKHNFLDLTKDEFKVDMKALKHP